METKYSLVAVFVIAAVLTGYSIEALECPLAACPRIRYPDACRAPSFLVLPDRKICSQCDQCFNTTATGLDDNGCPLIPCLAIAHPPECTARKFFVFQGQLCNDCDVNICPIDDGPLFS